MRSILRTGLIVTATSSALLVFAPAAGAHGLVGRADLPIPSWLFGWAAAIVLIASFVALATLWPKPSLQEARLRPLLTWPRIVEPVCGAIGVATLVLLIYSGLAGAQAASANIVPTFVYVIFWIGIPVLSILLGDWFSAFNPWRAIGRFAGWITSKSRSQSDEQRDQNALRRYPERFGRWPAAIGLLAFAWIELAYSDKGDPSALAWLIVVYTTVQFAGMVTYGQERWLGNGESFGVYFNMFARLAPIAVDKGKLCLRTPLAAVSKLPEVPGSVALLCIAIGTTSFDGFSNGPLWGDLLPELRNLFESLGAGSAAQLMWASTVGLLAMVLLIAGFYRFGVAGMHSVGGGHSTTSLARSFAHTLVPIAFAYAIAHYFSLLVFQGQAILYLISDPLGHGSNLIGTAGWSIDYTVIGSNTIWYVQVGALVVGHVCGLILAHDRALALYRKSRDAARSQYWMLVVMVGFTSLGLWLLSAVGQR